MQNQKQLIQKVILLLVLVINTSFFKDPLMDYSITAKTNGVFMKGSQKYLTATIALTNNTADTLKYLSMTCSRRDFYILRSLDLRWDKQICTKNLPITLTLPPHKSDSVKFNFLVKDSLTTPIKYQIGMILAKDEGNNAMALLTFKSLKSVTIWSDTVILRK